MNQPTQPLDDSRIDLDLRCVECGYNLRTARKDGVCPECGGSVQPSISAFLRRKMTGSNASPSAVFFGVGLPVANLILGILSPVFLMGFVFVWLCALFAGAFSSLAEADYPSFYHPRLSTFIRG